MVGIIMIALSNIKFLKVIVNKILLNLSNNNKLRIALISLLWIIIISVFGYMIYKSEPNSNKFWIGVLAILLYSLFMLNHFKDKNNYILLNEKIDDLYTYLQTMEDYIDSEKLNIHEYKNQLSVIKNMTNDKKIKKYIELIISKTKINAEWNTELKYLPKGGLKGLLYYKLAQAYSNNLNVLITVSKSCNKYFKKMSLENIKELSRIIGIFLDNAIEAASLTNEKNLSIEIYELTNTINIVISNTMIKDNNKDKYFEKGFSTKGKGRGNGLYLANKLINKNNNIKSTSNIIGNYYVQKLSIKKMI
ncbi:MAG: GHKL domain-containing protein [bacterium]|nr:GHKL domain-containing protein [bacterium]